jgi:hypothetical protein
MFKIRYSTYDIGNLQRSFFIAVNSPEVLDQVDNQAVPNELRMIQRCAPFVPYAAQVCSNPVPYTVPKSLSYAVLVGWTHEDR